MALHRPRSARSLPLGDLHAQGSPPDRELPGRLLAATLT
jgi:hypothetical protein